jgi:ATP-binding cassette subfamily F protein 3
MAILNAQNVSRYFGATPILEGITVDIPHGAKIALVGPNGVGKTTLLHILIGQDMPTDGEVHSKRGLQIGYLPQHPRLSGERVLWDEMLDAFADLRRQEQRLNNLEHDLADPDKADQQDEILQRYGRLQEAFEDAGGYTYEIEIKRVLTGLSFDEEDYQRPLGQLSGGQMTRALLARLLLEAPDLLVLDEPTNHLDIAAIEWLEGYLKNWEGALLIVSHDRYFMDSVVDTIWDMQDGDIEVYRGNYSHYAIQREERYERLLKEYEAQQEFIKKEEDYIRRNIAGQNTRQAQGRRKRLERLMSGTDRHNRELADKWLIKRPRRRQTFHMKMQAGRTGNQVLRTRNLAIGYSDAPAPLLHVPDILLMRGEVAAIIGPNGSGKSTFLKTIQGILPQLEGEVEWGARVKLGYFAQGHEDLNPENTVLDELLGVKNLLLSEARNYLATYLFQGDDVHRSVSTLSGGERGRLALAKLALSGANVLLLDEPSNHLDMPSQEILQNVLADYNGTILLVSHDRYLIDALASQIWNIQPGEMTIFEGNYKAFAAEREAQRARAEQAKTEAQEAQQQEENMVPDKPSHGLSPGQLQKRLAKLEDEVHTLEAQLEALGQQLTDASNAGNIEEVSKLGQQYNEIENALHQKMTEWMSLA